VRDFTSADFKGCEVITTDDVCTYHVLWFLGVDVESFLEVEDSVVVFLAGLVF
jgi:hypothetical protein